MTQHKVKRLTMIEESSIPKSGQPLPIDFSTPSPNFTLNEAKQLFIKYQSLHIIYKEKADTYRSMTGSTKQVYSDLVARWALEKANYYEGMLG